jgi:GntR family transcriptional repressor for pyruvate dehydrogenase complex
MTEPRGGAQPSPPPPAAGSSRISKVSVTRQVVDALYEALRSGRYGPGDRLPSEPALATAYGVGRSAVREAIRELLTLDVVEIRHGKGTFVRDLPPGLLVRPASFHEALERKVALELLEVRLIMEPEVAALAASRASAQDIARLRRDVEGLRMSLGRPTKPAEDLGFHLDLVRAAHNAALLRISSPIIAFYDRDEALPTQRDVDEHKAVVDAIERHDAVAARDAMRAHLAVEVSARTGGEGGGSRRG